VPHFLDHLAGLRNGLIAVTLHPKVGRPLDVEIGYGQGESP
jgi:hypothetical protein